MQDIEKNSAARKAKIIFASVLLLTGLVAAAALYRSPYSASDLNIVPDSVEYAVGGHHIAFEGRYYINIGGVPYPPRYPPWFSAIFLAPVYKIMGPEIGNGIYAITLMGILGVLAAFLIGNRCAGLWGGTLSALAVLALPSYYLYGQNIMTDVPSTAITLLLCLMYLKIDSIGRSHWLLLPVAGVLGAVAFALRPLSGFVFLPFILAVFKRPSLASRLTGLAVLGAPSAAVALAGALYNNSVFGTPFRSGYHFWCSVPYDYFWLTFSPRYLVANLWALCLSGIPILAALAALLWRWMHSRAALLEEEQRPDESFIHILKFLLLATGPLIAVHLFYFFANWRFLLPAAALLAVLCGSLVGMLARNWPVRPLMALQLVLLAVLGLAQLVPMTSPDRRRAANTILASTETNAIVVSSIDPVYLEFMAGPESRRIFIPTSRNVEYASKSVCHTKIEHPDPKPLDSTDHRCLGILTGGGRDVVPFVASEHREKLQAAAAEGIPVYLDASLLADAESDIAIDLGSGFRLESLGNFLYRLLPKAQR